MDSKQVFYVLENGMIDLGIYEIKGKTAKLILLHHQLPETFPWLLYHHYFPVHNTEIELRITHIIFHIFSFHLLAVLWKLYNLDSPPF